MYQVFHATHTYWRTTFGKQKSWTILECRQGLLSLREKCTIFITIFINNFFYIFVSFLDFDKEIHHQDNIIRKFWNLKTFH